MTNDTKVDARLDATLDVIQIRKVDVTPNTKLDAKRDSTLDTNISAKLTDTILGPKLNTTDGAIVDTNLVS